MFNDATFNVLDMVEALATEKGCTPSQLALAWVKQQPGITSPIIGPRTMAQLEDNLGAVHVELTTADLEKVDSVVAPRSVAAKYYTADFGPHRYRFNKEMHTIAGR